jgi:hypothetical protein
MARMIPPIYTSSTTSPGERQLFDKLKEDTATKDWIVLHSLDIAQHTRLTQGEADFIVLIPSKGILCIEVKAHQKIRRDISGYWYYGSNETLDVRGPFKQASQAMHSLRSRLKEKKPELSKVVWWSCVIFTHTPFNTSSGEWHRWQVIDSNLFNSKEPISYLIEQVLDNARTFLSTRQNTAWFKPNSNTPTKNECEEIAQWLRPSFDFFESPLSRSHNLKEELKRYTTEQFLALDRMAKNERVIFEGPAGTGKTLLAIETARRAKEQGLKTLFLCFNNLLGDWLQKQTAHLAPEVTTSTLHSYMLQIAGIKNITNSPSTFWQEELPSKAFAKLQQDKSKTYLYDFIIIDEAQDILQESYFSVLDKSMRGGFKNGKWVLFGDFEKQSIYSNNGMSLEQFRENWANSAAFYNLRENCRNTPNIAEYIHLLGNLRTRFISVS